MAYNKKIFVNDTVPPISAANLNEMEQGIFDANASFEQTSLLLGFDAVSWEVGAYTNDGKTYSVNAARLRSDTYIDITNLKNITSDTGYTFFLYLFNSSYVLLDTLTWASSKTRKQILDRAGTTKYLHIVLRSSGNMSGDEYKYIHINYADSINDKIDKLNETVDVPIGLINSNQGTLVALDAAFAHSNPINIYKTSGEYTTDFEIASLKKAVTKTAYISPSGSDDNDGTEKFPFETINQCITSGANEIVFLKGVYYAGTNFTIGQKISSEMNLIGKGRVVFYFGGKTNKLFLPTCKFTFEASCYVENIEFQGGYGVIVKTGNTLCAFNKCKFLKAAQNGLNLQGLGAYLVDCEASDNFLDGFNYHDDDTYEPTGVVEVKCRAYRNGNVANRSSNGSTVHDHGRIIRLGCEYGLCNGGVLADSVSKSYNFDIFSHDSTNNKSGDEQFNCNYNALSGSELWLYNCRGCGSRYELALTSNSIIHTDCEISSDKIYNDGTGTIDILS